MVHECLGLRETSCEAEFEAHFLEWLDINVNRNAELRINGLKRGIVVKESWRDHVCVRSEERLGALMEGAGHVQPAEFMDRRIDRGGCGLLIVLGMVARRLEAQKVSDVECGL